MQISISTRHGHLSDQSQEKIHAKVEKITRLFERLTAIELTIDLEHEDTPTVTLRVDAEHKHDFTASDSGKELMALVDSVVHKMEQQLRKYKQKVVERSRDAGQRKHESPAEPESEGA